MIKEGRKEHYGTLYVLVVDLMPITGTTNEVVPFFFFMLRQELDVIIPETECRIRVRCDK